MLQKRALVLGALLLCALCTAGLVYWGRSAGHPGPAAVPKVTLAERHFRLANGLTVELISGPCGDDAAVVLHYGVGFEHDPVGQSGLAFVVGRLVSATVDTTHTRVGSRVPAAQIPAELDRAAQRMRQLEVDPAAFEQAKKETLDEISRRRGGDPRSTAIAYAAESAHSSRAQGYFGGIAEDVRGLQAKDVTAWWQAHYQPGNLRVVIVGTFDPNAIQKHVEQALGSLPAGEVVQLTQHDASTVSGTVVMGDNPSALAFGLAAPEAKEPAFAAFLVLAARLDAAEALWQFDYDPLVKPDTLLLTATKPAEQRPESVADALRSALAKRLAAPLNPSEIAATKQRFASLLGTDDLNPEGCQRDVLAVAHARAHRGNVGIEPRALTQALNAVNDVQLDQARALFAPTRTAIVAAGGEIR